MNEALVEDFKHVSLLSASEDKMKLTTGSLEDQVNKLYDFRDNFFVQASSSSFHTKWEQVKEEMDKTLNVLQDCQGYTLGDSSSIPSFHFQYLLGKARNVLPDHDTQALEHLSAAVKLNPSYVDAWNELGECYWKAGNALSAKNCFSCALEKNRNKVSLRNLSVVLRQLQTATAEEKKKFYYDGLHLAKEALELDPTDSKSWLILGNSYLSLTFYSSHNSGCLQKALAAYRQSEKYEPSQKNFNSADLFYNKASALIFDEKYQEGIDNLDRSKELDPLWELPVLKKECTVKLLRGLSHMVAQKGKLKLRKLNNLLKSISSKDWGPYKTTTLERIMLNNLIQGVNAGKFILTTVVSSVPCEGGSPFACCVCDNESSSIAVTIYRLSQDYGLTIGDWLLIPEPLLHNVDVQVNDEVISFRNVRVDSPQTILVNGHPLRPNQIAPMFMKFSSS